MVRLNSGLDKSSFIESYYLISDRSALEWKGYFLNLPKGGQGPVGGSPATQVEDANI